MNKKLADLTSKNLRRRAKLRIAKKSLDELVEAYTVNSEAFLKSFEWQLLRLKTIAQYGPQCMRCKWTPKKMYLVHVDHIKPRRLFPELALDPGNLQVLCHRCNKEKASRHFTDYRPKS